MKHLITILSSAALVLALSAVPSRGAQAGVSITFSSGYGHSVHDGHRRHPGHNVHRGHRRHYGNSFGHRNKGHGRKGHGHNKHHAYGKSYGHHRRHGRHHRRRHHVRNYRCKPVYRDVIDRYGRELTIKETLCFDRFGRSFIPNY